MSTQEKVNILMVDDQPGKLLSYEVILAELGENLIKADSGKQALERLLRNDIAVVLMDVSMPEIDGFELANMIRQHPRFQQTAIIFISAVHLSDLDRLQGYQRGAVDYISVPVIPELLRAKVSVFAELHRKTRQLEKLNDDLRQLSSKLIAAQDEERRRIARELHDGLGQELSAAKMLVDGILRPDQTAESKEAAAAESSAVIERSIQQLRSMSHLLHPPLLDEIGLQSALSVYLEGFATRSGIEAAIDVEPANFPRLRLELETAIFRIVQEALTNVFRHAEARKAQLKLCIEGNKILLTVKDDGKGLRDDIVDLRVGSIGIGIAGMRQRVKEYGGDVRLQNTSPGTLVHVIIPITASAYLSDASDLPA